MASGLIIWRILPILALLCLCQLSGAMVQTCPHLCTCQDQSENRKGLDCLLTNDGEWERTCSEIHKFYTINNFIIDLTFQRSGDTFFPALGCLPILNRMAITKSSLPSIIKAHVFLNVNITTELDLSENNITLLSEESFMYLESLQSLNLSKNLIDSLSNQTFEGLISLNSLDLSYNRLTDINIGTFSEMENLKYLNLAFNQLVTFSSWHIPSASNLRVLILKGNNLTRIDVDRPGSILSLLTPLSSLDISCNPLDCSCTFDNIIQSLQHGLGSLSSADKTICASPQHLQNLSVLSLNETDLTCSKPRNIISYPSHEKAVVFKESITLECRSDGYPTPSIIWITPWGEKFAHAPTSLFHRQAFPAQEFLMLKKYEERNIDIITSISVNEKNDLIISNFRGSISGNFTCVAFNVAGNISETINLSIASSLKPVVMNSLLVGGYAASGMLIVAFIVGFIKMNIMRLSHKLCFSVPIFSTAPSVKPDFDFESSSQCGSVTLEDANLFNPSTSSIKGADSEFFSKGYSGSPLDSPSERRSYHIIESIEEAKDRLRYGVGRKVESMRKNVQSIKQSSSVYVHTIMESGSSAASRMKASMASGVETVKSHVQSFKELCGTGDMGTHTISTMSVETDIDTNQQRSIIKQITYV